MALITFTIIGWNYTEALKEKNAIEREKIATQEHIKLVELKQDKDQAVLKAMTETYNATKEADALKAAGDAVKAREDAINVAKEKQLVDLTSCLQRAQDEYDRRAAQGPIFGDGPSTMMESKKNDCQRLYGN